MMLTTIRVLFLATLFCAFPDVLAGQLVIHPDHPNYFQTSGTELNLNGEINYSTLLIDARVRANIEVVGEQKSAIDALIYRIGTENYARSLKADEATRNGDKKTAEKYYLLIKESEKEFTKEVKNTLLPNQFNNLKAMALTRYVKRTSFSQLATDSPVADALNLTDEEKKQFKKKAVEIEKELAKKIEKLRKEAIRELLNELPLEKRKLLQDKYGAPIGKKAKE